MKPKNYILSKLIFSLFLAIIVLFLPSAQAVEIGDQTKESTSTDTIVRRKISWTNLPIASNSLNKPTLDQLDTLNLTNCTFKENEGMSPFLKSLASNTSIASLSLINMTALQIQGLGDLIDALKENTTLSALNLSKNFISEKHVNNLADLLKSKGSITFLTLNENFLHENAVIVLLEALIENTTLKVLNLKDNKIGGKVTGEQGIIKLGNALQKNKTLTILNLEGNPLSDKDKITLRYMLLQNTKSDELSYSLGDNLVVSKVDMKPDQRLMIMKAYNKFYWAENNLYVKMGVFAVAAFFLGHTFCNEISDKQFCWEFSRQMFVAFGGFFFCYYLENLADF